MTFCIDWFNCHWNNYWITWLLMKKHGWCLRDGVAFKTIVNITDSTLNIWFQVLFAKAKPIFVQSLIACVVASTSGNVPFSETVILSSWFQIFLQWALRTLKFFHLHVIIMCSANRPGLSCFPEKLDLWCFFSCHIFPYHWPLFDPLCFYIHIFLVVTLCHAFSFFSCTFQSLSVN